jgi:hypothetical protein
MKTMEYYYKELVELEGLLLLMLLLLLAVIHREFRLR